MKLEYCLSGKGQIYSRGLAGLAINCLLREM